MSIDRTFKPGTPGVYYGLPEATYRSAHGVNISSLKKMAKTPRHYLAAIEEPQEPTSDMEFGTLVHLAVLEPQRLTGSYVVRPDGMKFTILHC